MDLVKIGGIANTQGLKGTLKVKSFTDFKKERYKKGNTLYILFKGEYIKVTVESMSSMKNLEYIKFVEYNNINDVEKFKGSELYISKEDIHDLNSLDDFYYTELIGMDVYQDKLVGKVIDVKEFPQAEYLVIEVENKKDILIPFIKEFIIEVDKQKNIIKIVELEGLIWELMY